MKKMLFKMVTFTFVLAIIIVIIVCVCLLDKKKDEKNYNNGICTECGGDYIFSSAAHVLGGDNYYYTCNKCGHTIKTDGLMK